ncbi:MAG TPA: multiheme c-type cytochrome [Spirochaetota bacterium]|nr:multiheme c-type cytochrome [Spirochaetota bacterium]
MKKSAVTIFLLVLAFVTLIAGCSVKEEHYALSRFISPDICGGCHDEIYSQWSGSTHQLAHDDIIYLTSSSDGLKGLTDKDEIEEAELCVKCHTPVGYVSGYPLKTSDDKSKIQEPAIHGVQCDYCHSVEGAYAVYNAKFKHDPGNGDSDPGNKRGPFDDSQSDFHKCSFSEFHTRSEMCGTCHDVRHVVFGTRLENTYQEWKSSKYNKEGVQCQDCHMYQREGVPGTGSTARLLNPGKASADGPDRKHIFTHYFIGGNTILPTIGKDKLQKEMAEERLRNAAVISVDGFEGDSIRIRILNNGAGHYIPTGLTHVRQAWIRIIVRDKKGKIVYSSGVVDSKGNITGKPSIYGTVFGDGKGNPVSNIAKAREILSDNRLKPDEEKIEKINIGEVTGKLTVEVALLYRGLDQSIADSITELKKIKVPVVVMHEAKAVIEKK